MSYYKITYESDTIEGLKAIQGGMSSQGTDASNSAAFETQVLPPPPQDEGNTDTVAGMVPAPPVGANMDAGLDFTDEDTSSQPPPLPTDAAMDSGSDDEIQPPPSGESGSQNENDGPAPPRQPTSKGSVK